MVQALIETKLREKYKDVFRHANDFLDVSQVRCAHILVELIRILIFAT